VLRIPFRQIAAVEIHSYSPEGPNVLALSCVGDSGLGGTGGSFGKSPACDTSTQAPSSPSTSFGAADDCNDESGGISVTTKFGPLGDCLYGEVLKEELEIQVRLESDADLHTWHENIA
jgi:hypothetical protein